MTSLAKAQPKKEQGNVLYILHRVAILIAVAAVFYPGFNPGRITTAINRNVSLFTASISYSAIVSNLERALLRGWVENTTFILVMVASIILIVGIIVCCIGGCMSVGNRRMRRYGLYFPLAGGVIMAAGLVCWCIPVRRSQCVPDFSRRSHSGGEMPCHLLSDPVHRDPVYLSPCCWWLHGAFSSVHAGSCPDWR